MISIIVSLTRRCENQYLRNVKIVNILWCAIFTMTHVIVSRLKIVNISVTRNHNNNLCQQQHIDHCETFSWNNSRNVEDRSHRCDATTSQWFIVIVNTKTMRDISLKYVFAKSQFARILRCDSVATTYIIKQHKKHCEIFFEAMYSQCQINVVFATHDFSNGIIHWCVLVAMI